MRRRHLMKRPYLFHVAWLGAVIAAYLIGSVKPLEFLRGNDSQLELANPSLGSSVLPERAKASDGSSRETNHAKLASSQRALSETEIEALGLQFRQELDPIARRLTFARLLEGLTVENAKLIREQIAHLREDSSEFREFHYAWGKIGGVDAVLNGQDTEKRDMEATIAGWASADPEAALNWFNHLETSSREDDRFANQGYLAMGLIHGLSNTDPGLATEIALQRSESGDRRAEHMLGVVAGKYLQSKGPEAAAQWAQDLPEGRLRSSMVGRVAHEYIKEDPETAAEWATTYVADEGGERIVHGVTSSWAREDGASAVAWLDGLDETPHTTRAYQVAFEAWAGDDPHAASAYLLEMPQSTQRDHAIGGLVNRHRWEDPQAAIAWASQIEQPKQREHMTFQAAEAYLRRHPEEARAWIPESGLSQGAQEKLLHQAERRKR